MIAWRRSAVGVLIPADHKPQPMHWPRPVGWDRLPADIRAAWDAPWRRVAEQSQGAR